MNIAARKPCPRAGGSRGGARIATELPKVLTEMLDCPSCGTKYEVSYINNGAEHKRFNCPRCEWGYITGAAVNNVRQ